MSESSTSPESSTPFPFKTSEPWPRFSVPCESQIMLSSWVELPDGTRIESTPRGMQDGPPLDLSDEDLRQIPK